MARRAMKHLRPGTQRTSPRARCPRRTGPMSQNGERYQLVAVTRRADGRWAKPCPECGDQQDYLRRGYAIASLRDGKVCKKCSNRKTDNCHRGFCGPVRLSWFHKFRASAEIRRIPFEIAADDVARWHAEQGGRCALSGLGIEWQEVGSEHTASIDRIDSNLGYTQENCQLVHKDINMMKQSFSQEYFVQLCRAVADKVKW